MGERRSPAISEATLARLTAADNDRVLTEGSGLSGKVHVGASGRISVHFRYRYRFEGQSREMSLGAWPRDPVATIRERLDETRLRVERGGDPAGQKRATVQKMQLEQEQIARQQRELAGHGRQQAEQQLTIQSLFEEWHPVAQVDNTPKGAKGVRRMFELHFLPIVGQVRVLDVKAEHVRGPVRSLIEAGKVPTALALFIYIDAMFTWAGRRRPWRMLFDVNPATEVDIDRLVPADFQSWCDRVLEDDEIIDLRDRFQSIRNVFNFRTGSRRGLATPIAREHELAVWIMLATLVRINEICAARWKEHIDLKAGTWLIPSTQAKNRKGFMIHLSDFAVRLLRELYTLTGRTPYLLPHTRDVSKPVTTAILQCAINSRQSWGRGWQGKNRPAAVTARSLMLSGGPWSCHDLRRTGATLMQACGFDEGIVERCLNHTITTQARRKGLNPTLLRTYQQYDYGKEMRRAWQALGEYLTKLDGTFMQIAAPEAVVVANEAVSEPPQLDAA
ncbi:integrase [Paraburkholderia sp. GAS448]|uniref:tyrosine-type recombinase/integrase n=1 Tax=Paraburkholderia sp. GAS448 TaxID=3035136 RepID=UPI003D1925AD